MVEIYSSTASFGRITIESCIQPIDLNRTIIVPQRIFIQEQPASTENNKDWTAFNTSFIKFVQY